MRMGKALALVVGAMAALTVMALAAVVLLVNPNEYKPRIVATVEHATGRELILQGDIKLSVFPWLALELGPASLGNPPGFAAQPLLSFSRASLRIRLWPLLSKRLEVGRVEVDGLDLRLIQNSSGRGNWEGLGPPGGEAAPPNPAGGPTDGTRSVAALRGISGIKIDHARVTYRQFTLENINLETGAFAEHGLVPVTLSADASRGVAGERVGIDAHFDMRTDFVAQRYSLNALNMNGLANLAGDNRPVEWSLESPAVEVNLAAQTLSATDVAVNLAGAHVRASVQGTKIIDAPSLQGAWALAPLVVREYLPRLGMTGPVTRDPKAWSLVSASSRFSYGDGTMRLDSLQATLDDTHLSGSVALNVAAQAHGVGFDLTVDRIDLDRYLPLARQTARPAGQPNTSGAAAPQQPAPPPTAPGPAAPAPAASVQAVPQPAASTGLTAAQQSSNGPGAASSGSAAPTATAPVQAVPQPATPIQALPQPAVPPSAAAWQANGTLAVGSVHIAPLDLANVNVTLTSRDHVTRLFPLTAQVDGGRYSGDIGFDQRGAEPILSLDEHLSGIDVGRLLEHSESVYFTGLGNMNLKATGHGIGATAILSTLDGHFDSDVSNGALVGVDLGYELGRAEALLNRQEVPAAPNTKRTAFEAFKLSAQIVNGVAATHDLLISSAALRITGKGTVNLPTQALNEALLAETTHAAGSTPLELPVSVTGTLSDPEVRPDVQALFKGELKQKVKELLRDKLKSLFGNP